MQQNSGFAKSCCQMNHKARNLLMDASLRLRFVQHDKTEDVIPHTSEESSAWMLHCACASFSMTRPKMSFRTPVRNPVHGCFTALTLRSA